MIGYLKQVTINHQSAGFCLAKPPSTIGGMIITRATKTIIHEEVTYF